jgi:hypothetical protein
MPCLLKVSRDFFRSLCQSAAGCQPALQLQAEVVAGLAQGFDYAGADCGYFVG